MRLKKIKNFQERHENCSELRIPYRLNSYDFRTDKENIEYFDPDTIFGRSAPLVMEIGCGKGQFVCEYARRNPNKNILAVECAPSVLVKACEKVKGEGLENIRFLEMKAEYLPLFIKEKSVSEIHLNFSTPYPKNKHKCHRLTYRKFLEIYKLLLCDGGFIAQKTDNQGFFEYSIESFSQNGFVLSNISLDLHNSDFEGNIVTEYEQKFASQGMPIYRLEARLK